VELSISFDAGQHLCCEFIAITTFVTMLIAALPLPYAPFELFIINVKDITEHLRAIQEFK